MVHRLFCAVCVVLCAASLAIGLEVRDSKNALVGTVVSYSAYPEWHQLPALTMATHNGTPYLLQVARQHLMGTHFLYYASPDCTGTPVLPMDVEARSALIAYPSAQAPDGEMWIMRRATMSIQPLFSYFVPGRENGVPPACEPWSGDAYWTTPMQPIGKLGTLRPPPYRLK